MSTIGTVLTVAEIVKLGMSLWMLWGKSQGMSEEELDKLHKEVKTEFLKNDPALLMQLLKENSHAK